MATPSTLLGSPASRADFPLPIGRVLLARFVSTGLGRRPALETPADRAEKREKRNGSEESEDGGIRREEDGQVDLGGDEGETWGAGIHGGSDRRDENRRGSGELGEEAVDGLGVIV